MSNTLQIALIAEGITDYVIIDAAIDVMLNGKSYILNLLQPETSEAFTGAGNAGEFGGGWKGVYKWCQQAVERAEGFLSNDVLFDIYDVIVFHLDADVASENPALDKDFPIPEFKGVLPCVQQCPPPEATTNELRKVILSWIGETVIPSKMAFCIPSKSTEAWIMHIFFPNDKEMKKKGWECYPKPENRLRQQPKKTRFYKNYEEYLCRKNNIKNGWNNLVQSLSEAKRFNDDFMRCIT